MRRQRGYSLSELLVVLVLLSVIMASIYTVLRDHRRYYAVQARKSQARDAVRIAAILLTSELRDANPGSDFYSLGPDSLALRSSVGMGIVCAASASTGLGIRVVTGAFGDGRADSVLLYHEPDPSQPGGENFWVAAPVRHVDHGAAGRCLDDLPPDLTLHLENPEGIAAQPSVGTPVRAFRPYVYRLYPRRGGWWLGQRLRGGTIQPIVGPLAQPASGGLMLEYLDADGAAVASADAISIVRVTVKSITLFRFHRRGASQTAGDSVSLMVYLRNS